MCLSAHINANVWDGLECLQKHKTLYSALETLCN